MKCPDCGSSKYAKYVDLTVSCPANTNFYNWLSNAWQYYVISISIALLVLIAKG
jgi:hypothetical protein